MNQELKIKKCLKCGALVKVIQDCTDEDCGIICCNEKMQELKPNSTDGAVEKHVPTYERKDGKLIVTVNHVMEEEHFIEWICLKTEQRLCERFLDPLKEAKVIFDDVANGTIYAYCNKHGLWYKNIE